MDFFREQDVARRNSRWLVVLFLLAVGAIVIALYLVIVGLLAYSNTQQAAQPVQWWQPQLFMMVGVGVSTVILLSSLFKVLSLSSGGGAAVAESLGGRLVSRSTNDTLERRLLNTVDEMAIASGIPVPKVYVLDDEGGINAFAAGSSTNEAVVAVTRGALEQLSRDELQGVIGHEFSHIFNGDMRLNIRLMGVLHGILVLALIGRAILRGGSRRSHVRVSSSSGKKDGAGAILLFALALFIIGYIGVFFGRLIKAAVSRQREFLADASAVQFTRNPNGIAGALRKIAGIDATKLEHPDAESASHMFFGNGVSSFMQMLATHPPVEERIARLDPYFSQEQMIGASATAATISDEAVMGFASRADDAVEVTPQQVTESVGNIAPAHINYAHTLLERLPEPIWKALRNPQGALALVYAIPLAKETAVKKVLASALPDAKLNLVNEVEAMVEQLQSVDRADWLPVLELAVPSLEELPLEQLQQVPEYVDAIIRADQRVTLFEFSLATLLRHTLMERSHEKGKRHKGGVKQVQQDTSQLLSLVVHAGHKDATAAEAAFLSALKELKQSEGVSLLPRKHLSLPLIEESLERLARLNYRYKGQLIAAASAAIVADGVVKVGELDFLRAIGASLDCPIPPLQVGNQ